MLLVVAAIAVLALGAQPGIGAGPGPGPRSDAGDETPARMLLRLHDLLPGYLNVELQEEQGERTLCSSLHDPAGTPKALVEFIESFDPTGCVGAYYRLFTPPDGPAGPVLAATGVLKMDTRAGADAAWDVSPQLLGRLFHDHPPRQVTAPQELGSETALFHAPQPLFYPFLRRLAPTASFLVWRSGNTLAVVMAVGPTFAAGDEAAVELARRQQAHIRRPTPYTRAERFDGEVALDDPALETPAYWLGRNFRPGGGLPDNRLFESYSRQAPEAESTDGLFEEGPGSLLHIGYENIRLDTWTPASWSVFADSKTGRAITTWKCTQTRALSLPEARATIFGGYEKDLARCPKRAPEAFTAWVDVGGVKVVVDAPPAADFIERGNPYGSFRGMEAIVRALRLRPKPTL